MEYVIIRRYYDEEMYLGISSYWFYTQLFRALPYTFSTKRKASERINIEPGEYRIITLDEFNILRIMSI